MAQKHELTSLHKALKDKQRVLLIAHKSPDGDAMGATAAFYQWLKREGKEPVLFCATQPEKQFSYLENFYEYSSDPAVFDAIFDAVIVFDSGSLPYAGVDAFMPRLKHAPLIVDFDHHAVNTKYGDINIIDPSATSTSELCGQFFESNEIFIDPIMATALLTGIFWDTNYFSNSATTTGSMDMGGRLISAGARFSDIGNHVLKDKNIPLLKMWGLALSRLKKNATYDVASTYIYDKDIKNLGLEAFGKDVLINFINAVCGGAGTIMVLHDLENGTIKGSLRSINKDVAKFAEFFGGGGHKRAAGFSLKGKIVETAKGFKVT
ncbi:MAG: bifunctional oligoribonuclease/PAP phosphatase NrnA [Patescibacteria group bacterium]